MAKQHTAALYHKGNVNYHDRSVLSRHYVMNLTLRGIFESLNLKTINSNLKSVDKSFLQIGGSHKSFPKTSTKTMIYPLQDESGPCYPGRKEDEQTFAYLIVDPFKRHVTLFCHFYGVGIFTF